VKTKRITPAWRYSTTDLSRARRMKRLSKTSGSQSTQSVSK
jgi:hypothetical protein